MQTYLQSAKTCGKNNAWGQAISRTVDKIHDFMALLPMARVEGAGLTFQRTGPEVTPHWITYGSGAVAEATPTILNAHTDLAHMADEIRIPGPAKRFMYSAENIQAQTQQLLEAQVNSFLDKVFNGNRPTVTLPVAVVTGVALATGGAGPYLQCGTVAAPAIGHLRCTVAGPVKTLAFQAPSDSSYGAESADQAAALPAASLILTSADGISQITVNVTGAALPAATIEGQVTISTTTFEFDGVRRLCPSTQVDTLTAYADGDDYSFSYLRSVLRANRGPKATKVLAMNPLLWERHRALQDAMHQNAETVEIGYSAPGRKFPAFEGFPVVLTEAIPANLTKGAGTALSEVWCLSLGVPSGNEEKAPFSSVGLCGLYGGDTAQEALGMSWRGFWMEPLAKPSGTDYYPVQVGADLGLVCYSPPGLSCVRYLKTTP